MKTFICGVCGYVHFGNEPPTNCPICFAPKEKFMEGANLKTPADPKNLTEGDKKHMPQILVDKEKGLVSVNIGEIKHVMTPEHYITHADLYLNKIVLLRVLFKPNMPTACFTVPLNLTAGAEITVIENCNVHGNWVATVTVS